MTASTRLQSKRSEGIDYITIYDMRIKSGKLFEVPTLRMTHILLALQGYDLPCLSIVVDHFTSTYESAGIIVHRLVTEFALTSSSQICEITTCPGRVMPHFPPSLTH